MLVHFRHFFVSINQSSQTLFSKIIEVIKAHFVGVVEIDATWFDACVRAFDKAISLTVHFTNYSHHFAIGREFKSLQNSDHNLFLALVVSQHD